MHGFVRCGRGCTVGLAVVALACLGHAAGGGAAHLGPVLLATMLVVACVVGGVLSAHEWSALRLVALLATAQAVCHVVLQVSMTSDTVPLLVGGHGGDPVVMSDMGSAPGVAPFAPSSLVMLAAHGVAVVVTALALRRLEGWALRAAEVVVSRWSRPRLLIVPSVPVPDAPLAPVLVVRLVDQVQLCDIARRGPPLRRTPVPATAA